jgi:hypothetical protein
VRVALDTEVGGQATALLPDKLFYAGPVAPGERATLVWSEEDVHAYQTPEPHRSNIGDCDDQPRLGIGGAEVIAQSQLPLINQKSV